MCVEINATAHLISPGTNHSGECLAACCGGILRQNWVRVRQRHRREQKRKEIHIRGTAEHTHSWSFERAAVVLRHKRLKNKAGETEVPGKKDCAIVRRVVWTPGHLFQRPLPLIRTPRAARQLSSLCHTLRSSKRYSRSDGTTCKSSNHAPPHPLFPARVEGGAIIDCGVGEVHRTLLPLRLWPKTSHTRRTQCSQVQFLRKLRNIYRGRRQRSSATPTRSQLFRTVQSACRRWRSTIQKQTVGL